MGHPRNTLTLVADIGGTNTRVALADGDRLLEGTIRRYANVHYPGLETVIRTYVEDEGGVDPVAACVAVAGPVRDGKATLTNVDWTIDNATLARAADAEEVAILNDLQALGHALGHLDESACRTLVAGPETEKEATKLVIGVGTGFNVAPVFHAPGGRLVTPAEAGHATLPARTDRELRLSAHLTNLHGFPSVEDAVAGRGLEQIYGWLGHEANDPREASSQDIMSGLVAGSDPRAIEAVSVFCQVLGSVAGNLALIHLPFGGIWLAGGMSQAMAPHLMDHGFAEAFRDKGRFAGFMGNFGIHVIEDDYAALIGCASYMASV